MKHTRFLRGGMDAPPITPPTRIPVEPELDRARQWQDHLKGNRQRTLAPQYPEPEQWVQNDEGRWKKVIEDDVFPEEHAKWEFNIRNMNYNDWNDRHNYRTDIGYVYQIHQHYGLDVILNIAEIDFKPLNFGSAEEHAANVWPPLNNIFTEISIEPGPHFVGLNSSGTYTTPNHYHITIVHTYDVGKGFHWGRSRIQEWTNCYNRLRDKYNGRHARLRLDRWGGGYTFYIRDAVVDGLPDTDDLIGDPDMHGVFNVPDKHKPDDALHVSLLI